MAETGRERWSVRVEEWKQSGLTAREYAARAGLNVGTLGYWKWKLSRDAAREPKTRSNKRRRRVSKPKLVELAPISLSDDRVEIELSSGHRLRLPRHFDPESLTRLVSILRGTS
jgi:transposase